MGSERTDRSNERLNRVIEERIESYRGTIHGKILKEAYKGSTSYEGICELMGLDPDEYLEGEED